MSSIDSSEGSSTRIVADRYIVRDLIAVGGMGEVFTGWDRKLERPVAIKLMRREMAGRADLRARFEAEARAGGRLSHPGIVAVFDTGEHQGLPFMIMELLTGKTVADELKKGAAEVRWSVAAARQALIALQSAHQAGILHRDLKPANLLLARDGSVKVADFGVAKVSGGGDLTQTGTMVGTPAYLAPERIAGQPASESSDVYAVGAILFELLAGFKPFQADNPLGLMRAIGQDAPPDLGAVRPELDPALIRIVEKALAKNPRRRFAGAAEMAAELRRVAEASAPQFARARPETVDSGTEPPTRVDSGREAPTSVLAAEEPGRSRTRVLPARARHRAAGGPEVYRLAGIAALVLGVIIVVMLVSRNARVEPPAPPGAEAPQGEVSPALDEALRRLEEAVAP